MHLLFFVTIWGIDHFFVINRGFFFGIIMRERERERERERGEWKKKGEWKNWEKKKRIALLLG